MIARLVLIWMFSTNAVAQLAEQEDILRLARIKQVIKKHLDGMPNYTCQQTVERYQKLPKATKESLIDVLRLEVAFVGGREMYAWPGSTSFEAEELRELVTTGAFSTGGFVLHARSIFLGDATTFRGVGTEDLGGVATWRFDYETAQFRSGYTIRNPRKGLSAQIGYHGSIWARKDNLELLRITIHAEDIPAAIEIKEAHDRLDYQMVNIGGGDALLPLLGEVSLLEDDGRLAINRTRLSRCKQYSGESTLRFEEESEVGAAKAKVKRELVLEPYTEVQLALEAELNHEDFAVGDEIYAVLRQDIKEGKTVIAPKGSRAKGRILRLEYRDSDTPCYHITLQFDEMSGEDWTAKLNLRLMRTEPRLLSPWEKASRARVEASFDVPQTDLNGFLSFTRKLKLPRGFTTIWQTQK